MAGLLLIFAAWVFLTPTPKPVAGRTESWMETVAPQTVGKYTFVPNPDMTAADRLCTFKSPQFVYDTLVPTVGILARDYEYQGERFEVYLIASRDKASFHDPHVCFTAQGFNILQEDQVTITTKSRGAIPATLAHMNGPSGPMIALYFYKGPHGFVGSTTKLKIQMLVDQWLGRPLEDAVFYRFIPLGSQDEDKLIQFIDMYMESADQSSKGYF